MNRFLWEILDPWIRQYASIPNPGPARNEIWSSDDWRKSEPWFQLRRMAAERSLNTLLAALEDSNHRLGNLGRDPAFGDWTRFRPLRLSREEDWSDWLAHMIETSSGIFNRNLFERGCPEIQDLSYPQVWREVITAKGFRADILVEWKCGHRTHIEVKIDDPGLSKTPGTALALRENFPDSPSESWSDLILLRQENLETWLALQATGLERESVLKINHITWRDVLLSLRKSFYNQEESPGWRSFALAYCGCIEQKILGFPPIATGAATNTHERLDLLEEQLRLVREAIDHER